MTGKTLPKNLRPKIIKIKRTIFSAKIIKKQKNASEIITTILRLTDLNFSVIPPNLNIRAADKHVPNA